MATEGWLKVHVMECVHMKRTHLNVMGVHHVALAKMVSDGLAVLMTKIVLMVHVTKSVHVGRAHLHPVGILVVLVASGVSPTLAVVYPM